MKGKIAVIGMGQGGMVAAIKMARYGADVTVYEKNEQSKVSYPWKDDITASVFEECGIERPDRSAYCQKPKWMFLSPDEKSSIRVPQLGPLVEISIDRQALSAHFADLLLDAGGRIVYGKTVQSLVLQGDRVVGIRTPDGELRYDLVIDASGLNSPFRAQLPPRFGVQAKVGEQDIMYGYRAFYDVVAGAETCNKEVECTGTFKHLDMEGLAWCNRNEQNQADVLVCRVARPLAQAEIDEHVAALRRTHAILGDRLLYERQVPLSARMSIATPLADGYCAIGDSAFMTIPVMGSGIETGMKGGAWLADWCHYKGVEDFTAANMWGFYYKYFKKVGVLFAAMDVVRRCALRLPSSDLNWALGKPVVTYDQLKGVMYTKEDYRRPKVKAGSYIMTALSVLYHGKTGRRMRYMVRRAVWAMRVADTVPKTYTPHNIERWVARYDGIITRLETEAAKKKAKQPKE